MQCLSNEQHYVLATRVARPRHELHDAEVPHINASVGTQESVDDFTQEIPHSVLVSCFSLLFLSGFFSLFNCPCSDVGPSQLMAISNHSFILQGDVRCT